MVDAILSRQRRWLVPPVLEHEAARHVVGDGAGLHFSISVFAGACEQEQRGYRDRRAGLQSTLRLWEGRVGHPPVIAAGAGGPGHAYPSDVVIAGAAALWAGAGVLRVPAVRA